MVGRGWGRLQLGPTICLGCVELSQHAAFPGRQPGGLVLPGLPFTSLFCPPLGFGAGHKAALQQPGETTTGKGAELQFLLQGCRSHGLGADPALLRVFSPHGTQQIAVFPLLFFLKLFPRALPCPASQAVPGEPAGTPDRAGLAPGRWLEAGSPCPSVTGSEPGLWESSSAYLVPWECFFSPAFYFLILPAIRDFSSGIPILLQGC